MTFLTYSTLCDAEITQDNAAPVYQSILFSCDESNFLQNKCLHLQSTFQARRKFILIYKVKICSNCSNYRKFKACIWSRKRWKIILNFLTQKILSPSGWHQWAKITKNFFDSKHQNGSIREKKTKKISNFLRQKNSITPAGVTSNGQKSPKFFFLHFWHQNDSIRKKMQKKILTQNLVLECVECGPKKGSKWFIG